MLENRMDAIQKFQKNTAETVTAKTKFVRIIIISVISALLVGNIILVLTSSHNVQGIYSVHNIAHKNTNAWFPGKKKPTFVHYTNVSIVSPKPIPCERNHRNCKRSLDVFVHNISSIYTQKTTDQVGINHIIDIELSFLQPKTQWIFHIRGHKNQDIIKCTPDKRYDIGIFPRYFMWAYNIGHFMLNIVRVIHDLIMDIDSMRLFPNLQGKSIVLVMPPHHLSHMTHTYLPFLKALKIDKMLHLYNISSPVCFRHVFLPSHSEKRFLNKETVHNFTKYFNITNQCPKNNIVLINRKSSRKILNSQEIINFAKSLGYTNSSVVYMEDLSIQEQMQVIHCADVLIGVQGAALTWFPFMPFNATFVEIGFNGWPTDFYTSRITNSSRPDLLNNHHNLFCSIRTSDNAFITQARNFGIKGKLTEALKRKVMKRSKKGDLTSSIYKQSDCICDVELFRKIVYRLKYYKQQFF